MASEPKSPEPFRFSDPRQEEIYRKLLLVGEGPAAFYRDACRLVVESPPLEGLSHLVSHLMREIESSLRAVLRMLGSLAEDEEQASDGHREDIRSILATLDVSQDHPVAHSWLGTAGRDRPFGLSRRAHRDSLARPRPLDDEFLELWAQFEAILEFVLDRFESRFLEPHALVDELLAKDPPTNADLRTLRNHVPNNPVTLGYFFERLSHVAWLEPLHREGFFAYPLGPIQDEVGRIAHPAWPQSRFLARVAKEWSEAGEVILKIALDIPEPDNVRIRDDLAEVALNLAPELAAKLVPRLSAWVRSPYHFLLPERLGALISHLAKGGQVDAALDLARATLEIRTPDQESHRIALDPRPWIDSWQYEQILGQNIPNLVAAAGVRALELLCDHLEQAIRVYLGADDARPPTDHSYIWRAAIEDHEQNRVRGIREALVEAVRDASEYLVGQETLITEIVARLEKRGWNVFRRIGLHMLRRFSDAAPDLVTSALASRENFENVDLWHEYALLLGECFEFLGQDEQETLLRWIDEGPAPPKDGEPYSDTQVAHWKVGHLAPFAHALPPAWQSRFESWLAQVGAPEHPDFVVYSGPWEGDDTPKSVAQLSAMSVDEIVEFLKGWEPGEATVGGSPREGLRLTLANAVATEPARFAQEAGRFKGLDAGYVHALFSGIHEALPKGEVFPWESALDLAMWVLKQPREPGARDHDVGFEPNWVWVRRIVADLLADAFEPGPCEIPFELRERAWRALEALAEDPNPTREDEAREGGANMDPATLSLNTVRGKAFHAVVSYAVWVKRHEEASGDEITSWSFDRAPEVRRLLDTHLNPSEDTALAIRAVYGWRLTVLFSLDPHWVEERREAIFPQGDELQGLRRVTWETHVVFYRVNRRLFDVIRGEYKAAISRMGTDRSGHRYPADPDESLAEHLLTLYWHGAIELVDPLLQSFFAQAPDAVRRHALRFIGRSLRETDGVDGEVLERLGRLWEARLEVARASPEEHRDEMAAFGWWFVSEKMDDDWAIEQLQEAVAIGEKVDVDRDVMRHLSERAGGAPRAAIACVEQLVQGDREGWRIYGWRDEIRAILSTVVGAADTEARATAIALVHRLGARGYQEFRDLLS